MPSTEQKQLVVHVVAETASGYNNASGIIVGPGRVLTAGHVLQEAIAKPEIRLCVLEPDNWIRAEILWDGRGEKVDAAVLKFDPDKLKPESRQICQHWSRFLINTGPWGSQVRWGSYGLPVAGWRTVRGGGRRVAAPTALVGTTGSLNPTGDLDLCADGLPPVAEAWVGASGSGVFIDHGLRAVIIEANLQVPNMLRALWIVPLLERSGFREAIQWSSERDWLDLLVQKVVELLSRADMKDLRDLLAKDLQSAVSEPALLAREWIARSALDFLFTGNRVGHALVRDGLGGKGEQAYVMAGVLDEIVEAGLAGKLGLTLLSRVVLRSRAGVGEEFVRLPCMEIVLAEFYNAGLDGRPWGPQGDPSRRPQWRRGALVGPAQGISGVATSLCPAESGHWFQGRPPGMGQDRSPSFGTGAWHTGDQTQS